MTKVSSFCTSLNSYLWPALSWPQSQNGQDDHGLFDHIFEQSRGGTSHRCWGGARLVPKNTKNLDACHGPRQPPRPHFPRFSTSLHASTYSSLLGWWAWEPTYLLLSLPLTLQWNQELAQARPSGPHHPRMEVHSRKHILEEAVAQAQHE